MRISTVFFIFLVCLAACPADAVEISSCKILETPIFSPSSSDSEVVLKMDYADYRIKNKHEWIYKEDHNNSIVRIDLIFTKYPANKSDWKINYDTLLKKRLSAIEELTNLSIENIEVNLILQTNCNNEEEAKAMFHGAILKLANKPNVQEDFSFKGDIGRVKSIIKDRSPFNDSLVYSVLERNRWKNMLVVIDWTASMYEYSAQVVLWNSINRVSGKIKQLVFFNDGDGLFDMDKRLGMTGGIYFGSPTLKIDTFLNLMENMMTKGGGGDAPENNIEAILKGMDSVKSFQDLVLVADNKGGIRDLELSYKIDKPVRIIVCGAKRGEVIHPDLLKLAFKTKGSLHTKEEDLYNIGNLKEGSIVKILGINYKVMNQGFSKVNNVKIYDFAKNRKKNEILSFHHLKLKK